MNDNIIAINKDREASVVQCGYGRTMFFNDRYKNLTFVHCSDMHNVPELWDRMVEYINYYSDYIDFAIHTGDYCGGHQGLYTDFYAECRPCKKTIYNCVGNHDVITEKYKKTEKEVPHKLLFNHTDDWNVSFLDCEYSMAYYKDFPEANIRLIVLNLYYDIEIQQKWLKNLLKEAKELGLYVITAMHEPSDDITDKPDTAFNSLEDFAGNPERPTIAETPFEHIISDYISSNGKYVCNLAGHMHNDLFGYTKGGVLNIAVECGTDWYHHCDGRRIKGTVTYDCFNVMAVDVNLGLIKLVRIGDNVDNFMRQKLALCYDFKGKRIIC